MKMNAIAQESGKKMIETNFKRKTSRQREKNIKMRALHKKIFIQEIRIKF